MEPQEIEERFKRQLKEYQAKYMDAERKLQQARRENVELATQVKVYKEQLARHDEQFIKMIDENRGQIQVLKEQMSQVQKQLEKVEQDKKREQKDIKGENPRNDRKVVEYVHQENQLNKIDKKKFVEKKPSEQKNVENPQKFDVIVPIKKSLIDKNTVALFQNRLLMAKIFSFYGYRGVVCQLLQRLSHGMRAIAVQTQGLRSEIEQMDIHRYLRKLLEADKLDHYLPWGIKNVRGDQWKVLTHLEASTDFTDFPQIRIKELELSGELETKQQFVNECKQFGIIKEAEERLAQQYFYGYLLDHFEQMLNQNQLVFGTKTHKYHNAKLFYKGGLNRLGKACGFGFQRMEKTNELKLDRNLIFFHYELKFIGTFLDDMRHGIVVTYNPTRYDVHYWWMDKKVKMTDEHDETLRKVERYTKEFVKRLEKK